MRRRTKAQPIGGAIDWSFCSSKAYSGGSASGMVAASCAIFMSGPLRPPSNSASSAACAAGSLSQPKRPRADHPRRKAADAGSDPRIARQAARKPVRLVVIRGNHRVGYLGWKARQRNPKASSAVEIAKAICRQTNPESRSAVVLTRSFNPSPIQRPDLPGGETSILLKLATIALVIGGLYFGAPILVPLALAMLLSFALAPLVRMLRRLSIPNVPSVLVAVCLAVLLILALGWIVAWQGTDLAQRLPTYRYNIEAKIDRLRDAPPGGQLFERAADMIRDLRRKIEQQEESPQPTGPATKSDPEPEPIPVEIRQPPLDPMQVVRTVIGPLISPLATAGLVVVFVIFMLLEREDLRDRFVRLAGYRDLPRTTQAIDDAARRVARYLLMQLVVNITYAIPIWLGLWLIGLPNPVALGPALRATPLRPLYRSDHRGLLSARARDRRRSQLDDIPPGRGAVHCRRADQQQFRRAVALRV